MQFQTPKAAKPRGYGLCSPASTIQTRKIESDSIQFCIGHLVLFDFICFQLSCFYGLSLLVLSICYHEFVITLLSELGFTEF